MILLLKSIILTFGLTSGSSVSTVNTDAANLLTTASIVTTTQGCSGEWSQWGSCEINYGDKSCGSSKKIRTWISEDQNERCHSSQSEECVICPSCDTGCTDSCDDRGSCDSLCDECDSSCDSSCDSCDSSCDSGSTSCDSSCDDCDSWCDSSCDESCDSSCDESCDSSCDYDISCDSGCNQGCDYTLPGSVNGACSCYLEEVAIAAAILAAVKA